MCNLCACELPGVPSAAVSLGNCDINLLPERKSEPRQTGITTILMGFDVELNEGNYPIGVGGPGGLGVTIQEATCSAPTFVNYSGSLTNASADPFGHLLQISMPVMPNARTYRFNLGTSITAVPNQEIEVRGLISDTNSDGRVNATGRSVVVGAWTGADHWSCRTDLNNDGATNATDRSIVVGAWTGGATNCAP